jgi:hypothetical protein
MLRMYELMKIAERSDDGIRSISQSEIETAVRRTLP